MSAAKTTVVALLVLALTFASGIVVGIGITRFMHMGRGPRGGMPPFAAHMIVTRLDHHLDLTDAQEAQILTIFNRRHQRMAAEIAETNAEIERVLTPAQKEKFRKIRMHLGGPGPR